MTARATRGTAFSLAPCDDPLFDRRLLLPSRGPREGWIRLTYRIAGMEGATPPQRPMIRLVRAGGVQDFVMPGATLGAAVWLGLLPADLEEIRLAAPPGFALERVALHGHAHLLVACLRARPARLVPALYARLRGDERRFRDILRGACAATPLARYPAWADARRRPPPVEDPAPGLAIRLVLHARAGDGAALARTVAALRAQTHPAWTLAVLGDAALPGPADPRVARAAWDAPAPPAALLGEADALGILHPGDRLWPEALALLAGRLAGTDAPDLVYADAETAASPGGAAAAPLLKPDWSPDLALVTGYHGRPCLLARALVTQLPADRDGPPDGLALELAAASAARRAAHVPRVLCLGDPEASDLPARVTARTLALGRHLAAIGAPARVATDEGVPDLAWPLPEPAPLASVIIPSRDRLDLIGPVTEGVLRGTDYPAIELVIVDNGSTEPGVLRLYASLRDDPRVRILSYPHPFHFSAMVNAGARAARGSVLVLLNNDVVLRQARWLAELVAQALRPEVGAVGAKLLYGNGTLQHAGVVVGLGGRAGHILRRRPAGTPGHLGRLRVAHEVAAVTAACLAVVRAKYEAVGGFDEAAFAIDFNDVDFCLRLGARGWKTVWTPRAVLSHLESVSRGPPMGPERRRFEREAEAFAARWRGTIRHDPFYHPALSLTTFGEDLE